MEVDGRQLAAKAVLKNDICYLPAVPLAEVLKVSLSWNPEAAVLVSPYGQVSGTVKKDLLYFSADDVGTLFHLTGGLTADGVYEFHSMKPAVVQPGKHVVSVRYAGSSDKSVGFKVFDFNLITEVYPGSEIPPATEE